MQSRLFKSLMVMVLIIALLLPFGTISVNAAYENTYKNTGNMRDDIIGVALTQVGYSEGSNNYTKYGVWYGLPNSPWCGMFVSWCANQAGIPTSVLKRTGIANPSNFGLSYKSGSNYTPQKGDLFFKSGFSHVGLVYYTDGAYFYTIEGNTSTTSYDGTSVMIRRRKISDCYFSSPNYSGSGSSSSSSGGGCSHSYGIGYEGSHPHKEYQKCSKCGKTSYTGKNVTVNDCKTCIQEACDHSFGQWTKSSDSKHSRICSKCELTESKSHEWNDGKVTKEATCAEAGSKLFTCTVCNGEVAEEIPATGNHTYGSAAYIDDNNHQKICSVCGKQELFAHAAGSAWKNDALYHWSSCADCGGRLMHTEHTFSGGCLQPCDSCGYTQESGHTLDDTYQYDADNHWQVCLKCAQPANTQVHIFSSACDETCNICGYARIANVEHTDIFLSTEATHWRECTTCKRTTPQIQHTADRNSEEWEDLVCIQCKHVLVSSDRHEHVFHTVAFDQTSHWGTCECGEELAPEVHCWDVATGTCSICHTEYADISPKGNLFTSLFKNLFK